MYVHGGGMTSGDKSDLDPIFLDLLAQAGYAVVSVDYRLAPASHFPTQIRDVTCAIRYLRAKAARYGLDKKEFFAFGTSRRPRSLGPSFPCVRPHRPERKRPPR
jgi:acetyl esterase/lipase